MKKVIYFILFLLSFPYIASAQSDTDKCWKKKYRNIGFVKSTMSQEGFPDLKSNYGANLTFGRTYYLHKTPVLNLIKFGIDATWFDLNYTNFDILYEEEGYSEKYQLHQAEVAMQVGPSITLMPFPKFNIHTYFRYAPSFSCNYVDEEFQGNYATFFVTGGTVSYKNFGLGMEARFGHTEFEPFLYYEDPIEKVKTKTKGFRAFITLKF